LSQFRYQELYRRHLPHIQTLGCTLFVTFRLAGSLPDEVVIKLHQEALRLNAVQRRTYREELGRGASDSERRLFGQWDSALDTAHAGPVWLRDARVARLVAESCHHRHGRTYDLDTFCIMPNHVHLVFRPLAKTDGSYHSLSAIMHSLKGYTAHQANQVLGRTGAFWQHENYDHVVRSEDEWHRIVTYLLSNPVKAGLVDRAEDWKWCHCRIL